MKPSKNQFSALPEKFMKPTPAELIQRERILRGVPQILNSQTQCASILGITGGDVKLAKEEGCPAFRSGRIYSAELVDWLRHPLRCTHGRPRMDVICYRRTMTRLDDLGLAGVETADGNGCYDSDDKLIPREKLPPLRHPVIEPVFG